MPVGAVNLNMPVDYMELLRTIVQRCRRAAGYTRWCTQCKYAENNWELMRDDLVNRREEMADVFMKMRAVAYHLPFDSWTERRSCPKSLRNVFHR